MNGIKHINMDYEKKYNEALKRAKELIAKWTGKNKDFYTEDYSYIFPELAESEDERNERIRKAIVLGIKRCADAGSIFGTVINNEGVKYHEVLTWLEKQKESLHIPETCKEKADSFIDDAIEVRSFQRGMEEGRRLEKQKATNSEKPKEWSDEDENILLSIINAFRNGTVSTIGQEQWLKSLHERFNPQPKQEWSEEDEEMKKLAIDWLSLFHGRSNTNEAKKCIQECIDWLKSLRLQPHWKPSEEQMCYLKKVYESYDFCDGERDALEALYNDLKKLM